MKGQFPQFEMGVSIDYKEIWQQALFVFDTNVLLNLYRYQPSTRDQLLNVLERLNDRIWVPHHVALEFQRNRLKVVADQNRRFTDVRQAIEKAKEGLRVDLEKLQLDRRHSLIDPQPLISGLEQLSNEFLDNLNGLQETQQKLTQPDALKEKIERLFDGHVGPQPADQGVVDELYKEAERRFKLQLPPGFEDAGKDKKDSDAHMFGGLVYKRKYGDFVVWRQLLEYACSSDAKFMVFITDDAKDDWWWKIHLDGPKTLGPRPELVEEAHREGKLQEFLMYNSEGFLKFSKEFLEVPVSEETLEEVRDVSTVRSQSRRRLQDLRESAKRAEAAVQEWLSKGYSIVHTNGMSFPDFVAEENGRKLGFEVKLVSNPRLSAMRLREVLYRSYYEISEGNLDEITFVWIVENQSEAEELKRALSRVRTDNKLGAFQSIIGSVNESGTEKEGFKFIDEFSLDN